MAGTPVTQTSAQTSNTYANFFHARIRHNLHHWRDHAAVRDIAVETLDHKRENILKIIAFGLELTDNWPAVRDLMIAFTPYMERRGHWEVWNQLLHRAIDAARYLNDVDAEITLTALLARVYQRQSRPKEVIFYYRRVIRLARETGNQFEMARACSNLGYLYIDGGHRWRSEVLSCHALTIFETLDSDHGRAHTHNHLGVLYTRQKHWKVAENHLKSAC